jgi:hypothetical protein
MTLNLEKVHDYKRIPGTTQVQLVGSHPATRVRAAGEPPIFIQDGLCYSEGGQQIDKEDLPGWFWPEAAKMSETALVECGLSRAEVLSRMTPPESPAPTPVAKAASVAGKK